MGGWNFIDRTNMRFGKLVAQKYLGNKKWLCHCDCGNDCVVNSDRLPMNSKRRMQKSCGCLRVNPVEKYSYLIGQKVNKWTVLEIKNDRRNCDAVCICECGTIKKS